MRRFLRVLVRLFGVLLFLLLLAASAVAGLLWLTLPPGRGDLRIPGLSSPVDVTFDTDGIPRIRAANLQDAAAALGWVHARDRMFQMELMRRAASGRLSEIAGPATLRLDEMARTLGLRRLAEADLATLPAATRAILQAYANGVNAWIDARGRFAAPEFLLLGKPEPWTPVDSLLWGETMAGWLSYNYRTELARLHLTGKLPTDKIRQLWPSVTVPGPEAEALPQAGALRYAALAGEMLRRLPHFPGRFTQPDEASDEWAVDGQHSATGAPLLAGDPHLAFGFPSIWYLARIDTPDASLAGATAPGVPFLILGRNRDIAWSFTTTGADTQDVFIETVLPDGDYQTPDGPKPFTVREERIRVRGRPDVVIHVRESRHGPIISDVGQPAENGEALVHPPALALAAVNLAPGSTAASGIMALNAARTVEEAGRAAAEITTPMQNLLVADHSHIALFTTGRVPVRKSGDGWAPVPGASGAYDWTGTVGGIQLPFFIAPDSGRLVNANERTAPPDFPVFLGLDWFGDWRAQRIRALLDEKRKLSVDDFTSMQVDATDIFARQLLPLLTALPPPDGVAGRAAALLQHWGGEMAVDLPQPLIFNAWIQRFYLDLMRRAGIGDSYFGPWQEFVAWVVTPAGADWCGGDCKPILLQALHDAVAGLSARFGNDPAAWRWGDAHQAIFRHPLLGALPLLGRLTTSRIAVPGDDQTLFRGGAPVGRLESLHGPEYRGVYDLADLDLSRFVIAPGQSGNLLSRHAHDFLTRWRDGGTVTLGPGVDHVEAKYRLSP